MKHRDIVKGLTESVPIYSVKTRFHLEIKDKDKIDHEVKSQLQDIVRTKNHFYKNGYYTFFNNNGDESTVKLTKDRFYSIKNNKMVLDVLYIAEPQEDVDREETMNRYYYEVKRDAKIEQNVLLNNKNDIYKSLFQEAVNPFTTFQPSDSSSTNSTESSDIPSPPVSYDTSESEHETELNQIHAHTI